MALYQCLLHIRLPTRRQYTRPLGRLSVRASDFVSRTRRAQILPPNIRSTPPSILPLARVLNNLSPHLQLLTSLYLFPSIVLAYHLAPSSSTPPIFCRVLFKTVRTTLKFCIHSTSRPRKGAAFRFLKCSLKHRYPYREHCIATVRRRS